MFGIYRKTNKLNTMKNEDKKGDVKETLLGLIIFGIMLVTIILFFRGCSDGRLEGGSSLEEVKQTIERVNNANTGTIEILQINIPDNTMLIGYAPGHEAIITRYTDRTIEIETTGIAPSLNRLEEYTFPQDDGFTEKTLQKDNRANFFGYFKERADTCPLNSLCICECERFELETKTDEAQIHKTFRAHITCAREQCQIIQDIKTESKIKVKDFFSGIDRYNRETWDNGGTIYPNLSSLEWEGGFVIVRTENYEIGEVTTSICHGTETPIGSTGATSPSIVLRQATGSCSNTPDTRVEAPMMIAGNILSYPPFGDLEIRRRADGVRFRVVG